MFKLSACIEMLFTEQDFYKRIIMAKKSNFEAIEFWGLANKDINLIKELSEENNIKISAFTVSSKNKDLNDIWSKRGLTDLSNYDVFQKIINECLDIANYLKVKKLILTVGPEISDIPRFVQHKNIVESIKKVISQLEKNRITVVIEPLNTIINHKGYYLYSSEEGFNIIKEVNSPNVKLLYDIYHQQITEGNLINTILKNINFIGHFHIADVPDRHEPGTGEINYLNVLKAIKETHYSDYVGFEYQPYSNTLESIKRIYDILEKI